MTAPHPSTRRGIVALVGAGPGKESLITEAGIGWLRAADVVVCDRLASPALLAHCRGDAEWIYVGKSPGNHRVEQDDINRLLIEKCRQGWRVVRLKGGDPLIFGRGAEEAAALRQAGCDFCIVPGVTAAVAAGAYAGIALTHRATASTVAFVTGHEDSTKAASSVNYTALAGIDTLVFYMGLGNLPTIAAELVRAGKPDNTPVAVIAQASLPAQRTVEGDLATIADVVRDADIRPPAVVIVGPVAAAGNRLPWLEALPLHGQTILVTRPAHQAKPFSGHLAQLGANVIESPAVEIAPPHDWELLDAALARLGEYDWVAFTSANGVAAVFDRLAALGRDGRAFGQARIAAIGQATADALRDRAILPDLVPATFTTAALGEALSQEDLDGCIVLLPRADQATPQLAAALCNAGADVEEIVAYRAARPAALAEPAIKALRDGRVQWVTFASSVTVCNFLSLLAEAKLQGTLEGVNLASIGPVTSQTLADAGLTATVTAQPHTIEALAEAMAAYEQDWESDD